MTPVVNVVQSSTHILVPAAVKVPGILSGLATVILKIRLLWSWYRWGKVYTNENNWYKLVAGHVVNYVFGDSVILRIAAQCILIANRIFKCVNQTVKLSQDYHKWVDAIKGNYSHQHSMRKVSAVYEMTNAGCCQSTFGAVWERIKRVAIATFNLIKRVFKLTMYFMDAIDSFYISPATRNESINQLFVNGTSFLDNLVKNQERLLDMIENNRKLVAHILSGVGSTFTVAMLVDTISKTLATAETVQSVVNAGGGVLKKTAKHAIFGAATMVGMAKHLPTSLVPTKEDDQLLVTSKTSGGGNRPVSLVLRPSWGKVK